MPFTAAALASIESIKDIRLNKTLDFSNATKIDTHVHAAPDWYIDLVTAAGGANTQKEWSIPIHLQFMANNGIDHCIISISTPGSTVIAGNETLSIGLARSQSEWLAEVARVFPERFSFYSVTPLPYAEGALQEVEYAHKELDAKGIGLLTNHEGYYMGDPVLLPFFAGLNAMDLESKIVFMHPTMAECNPSMSFSSLKQSCSLITISANHQADPRIPFGQFEFHLETARNLADMITSRTLHNFTSLRDLVAHIGNAFPSIQDRAFNEGGDDEEYQEMQDILHTRVWYESAGATFQRQVQGLLAYGVPKSQLMYGTVSISQALFYEPMLTSWSQDFAYTDPGLYDRAIKRIENATFLTDDEKEGLFQGNAKALFNFAT